MNVAEGSVEECRYFLILANDLGYGDISSLSGLLDEVSRMLNAYASAILASHSLTSVFHIPKGYQGKALPSISFQENIYILIDS